MYISYSEIRGAVKGLFSDTVFPDKASALESDLLDAAAMICAADEDSLIEQALIEKGPLVDAMRFMLGCAWDIGYYRDLKAKADAKKEQVLADLEAQPAASPVAPIAPPSLAVVSDAPSDVEIA